ncbi:hypothetical protein [Photobacterium kishitanii]|uniref:hypothetical protein n=1 Tax=Photobacterium kishitanii TaxID=318456 RepID=UPI000D17E673|nr:hypothetical protein [Photobacterium kishitanii]PSV18342.1 hypothetical protein C0W28_12555 [Photobacterium kishitanii]
MNSSFTRRFFLIVLSILIIFDPWFFGLARGVIIGGFFTVIIFLFSKSKSNKHVFFDFFVLFVFTMISIIPAVYNYTFEMGVYQMYVKVLLYYFIYVGFVSIFKTKDEFIHVIKDALFVQCLIIAFCVFNFPYVKDIVFSVHTVPEFYYKSEQEYRLFIFTSSSFFQLSLFLGFVFNFALALYKEKKVSLYLPIAIAICGVFSGRSFIIFAAITILFYGFNIKTLITTILVSVGLIYLAYNFSDNKFIYHALEPLIQFIQNGRFDSSSSNKLINDMLFIPTSKQILVGDGMYYTDSGGYYGGTDSGFIRQALYGGLGYVVICILCMFYFLKNASGNWFVRKKTFILSSGIIFILGNIKADVMMYPGLTFFFLIIISSPLWRKMEYNNA